MNDSLFTAEAPFTNNPLLISDELANISSLRLLTASGSHGGGHASSGGGGGASGGVTGRGLKLIRNVAVFGALGALLGAGLEIGWDYFVHHTLPSVSFNGGVNSFGIGVKGISTIAPLMGGAAGAGYGFRHSH